MYNILSALSPLKRKTFIIYYLYQPTTRNMAFRKKRKKKRDASFFGREDYSLLSQDLATSRKLFRS